MMTSWPTVSIVISMEQDEFARRFTEAVVRISFGEKRLPFGRDPNRYAANVLMAYWREFVLHGGTPERYAQQDAVLWE